ncbi:NAD(P)-dependent oxidoreductase [Paenibacillus sp. AR247]|uniref:NAD(P)-dependent oxidoreductase n=1 Tax=Paenibacillus sp. AR247 TaxID=1631599 RepID=UPI0021571DDC|nr:NAD(P)-dependent oxidoreductase [Paenibacillus sp. AR247]
MRDARRRRGDDGAGKRLGLLGLGHIGSNVARIGQAFGMEVMAWSQNLTADKAAAAGVKLASSKDELLESSDFVSIHVVLSDRTRGLIGARELGLMRPSAYLINTSRAPIVDREALIEALRSGKIAGAGLDVFEQEPLPVDDPLRTMPNVLATPHIGYVTEATYRAYFRGIVEAIDAYLKGSPINVIGYEGNVITLDMFSRCLELGAYAAVVGGAIMRPKEITFRIVQASAR